MRFTLAPTLEELMNELVNRGWSVGDVAIDGEWSVYCSRGGESLRTNHSDRTQAWAMSVEQARLLESVKLSGN